MGSKHYLDEFKIEAIKKIAEKRYTISEVSNRLG